MGRWHKIVKIAGNDKKSRENWPDLVHELGEKLQRITVTPDKEGECQLTADDISWPVEGSIFHFISEAAARHNVRIELDDADGTPVPGVAGLVEQSYDDRRAWEALRGAPVGLFAHELVYQVMRAREREREEKRAAQPA